MRQDASWPGTAYPAGPSVLLPAADTAPHVALPWVVKLRYGLLAGEIATIASTELAFGVDLPIRLLTIPIGITLASNYLLGRVKHDNPETLRRLLGWVFCLDTFCLTAALSLCGGPLNPFSLLYLVQITVSAVVLDRYWTWILGALSTLCFGLLFWVHRPLPELAAHQHTGFSMHLTGMWIAFAIAASLTAFFIGKVSEALRAREQEVLLLEKEVAKSERLAALVTLAAGAAHELGTPLGSIAVAAKELERYASQSQPDAAVLEDAQLIRSEVERCRQILQKMSARGAETLGESAVPVAVDSLVLKTVKSFPPAQRDLFTIEADSSFSMLPPEATMAALSALMKNALDANSKGKPVNVRVESLPGVIRFSVSDRGDGMPPDVLRRVAEPFFTTKEPGRGMGLGTFLVRLFAERMGGTLRFESEASKGTTAILELPSPPVEEKLHGSVTA